MTQIGYITPNNVPIELIEARGITPREIVGTPSVPPTLGDEYMETFFDGHVRSIFDKAVTGQLADLDLLIIPRTSEGYLQLFYYLEEARRWLTEDSIPRLHLFDLLQTPAYPTSEYVHSRVQVLDDVLTSVTATAIDADALHAAIAQRNAWRDAVHRASGRRRAQPAQLRGSTFLSALRQSGQCSAVDSARRMNELPTEQTHDGFRILVKGSPHDDVSIYTALEDAGFSVVADDHFAGEGVASSPVQAHPAGPLWALAEHYQKEEVSLRSYPQSRQDDRFIELARDSRADAVLFIWEENDDTLGWDYPEQRRRLDSEGIAHAVIRDVSYFTPDVERIVATARELRADSELESRTA